MKRFFMKLIAFFIAFSLLVGGFLLWFKSKSEVSPGKIEIFEGAPVRQVSDILELSGIIDDSDVFYYYIRAKQIYFEKAPWKKQKFEVNFKPGSFTLEAKNFDELIDELNEFQNASSNENKDRFVTIPEGTTVEQMAEILASKNVVDAKAFLQLTNDQNYYKQLKEKYMWLPEYNKNKRNQLEGYLHSNTYDFDKNTLPHKIIEKMLEETNKWYEDNKVEIINSKHSFEELLTLASVIEKESKFKEDRPKVSQVFYNRLAKGMKLESDITAAYANGEHKVFMTHKDIKTDSPFNTYKTKGLPLGPINSPSKESFMAALKPAGSSFKAIYFYARPNGQTFYAETFDQHEVNRKKYEKEWLDLIKK
ncbi:endolytic transglycosylase MltG [Bacillus sp. Brlt_9]|uniref:endolytic transglycosylase MltG n=1 Tax=Bacillus sp. Brlt_9 TaxID=3110916 RepID=UPI003F7CB5BA